MQAQKMESAPNFTKAGLSHGFKYLFVVLALVFTAESALQQCQDSYFFDTQHCQRCQENCKCQSQNTCLQCVDGFTYYEGSCIECPRARANSIYGECSECCSRKEGTILACTDCTNVPGLYSFLFAGRCILSDGCFQVDQNGFCTECRSGYYETNNLCFQCHQSCKTCSDNSNCLRCQDGFFWKLQSGGLCTQCPTGCANCNDLDICYSCLSGYYIFDDHCLKCPINCLSCADGSTCTECSKGILVSNLCVMCTDSIYGGSAGCLSCSEDNNFVSCNQCDDKYFLDISTGMCRLCQNHIQGAIRCKDENTPTQCQEDYAQDLQSRYYLIGLTCVANIHSCKKVLNVQGLCVSCYPGYILSATNKCQKCDYTNCSPGHQKITDNQCQCTQCEPGFYLTAAQLCNQCSTSNCAACPQNNCIHCLPDYYWTGTQCSNTVNLQNCDIAESNQACKTCSKGYYLGSDGKCYKCQQNCVECRSRSECSLCADSSFLHPDSYCVTLPSNCVKWNMSLMECSLCKHGYYLLNGFCQSCQVQTGTLSMCQGLCPIDYYISELLVDKTNGQHQVVFKCTLLFSFLAFILFLI